MFSCKSAGSTNDILAWDISSFKFQMDDGMLPLDFYIVGDEAFTCSNQLLVPWSGRGLDEWKDSFNYHLSVMRQCIERAFALLTNRWGIFWRPLRCAYKRWSLICMVCAKLHNYCIDMGEGKPSDIYMRRDEDHEDGDAPIVELNGNLDPEGPQADRPSGDRRRFLTQCFERDGVRRPSHAFCRS